MRAKALLPDNDEQGAPDVGWIVALSRSTASHI